MRFSYKYSLFVLSLIVMNASCNEVHKKTVKDSKNDLAKGFKVIDGDTLYVGEFTVTLMKDSVEISLMDSVDVISYDGKQGYIIKETPSEDTEISVVDLKSGEILKKSLISDIIKRSDLSQVLSDSGTYEFYYAIERVFPSSRGVVVQNAWLPNIYFDNSRIFLFLNKDLQIEKVAAFKKANTFLDPGFCIDYGDSVVFTLDSRIGGVFYFNKKRCTEEYVNWPEGRDVYDFVTFNTYYINSEFFISNIDSNIKLSRNLIVPRVIVNNRFIYFDELHTGQKMLVYDLTTKELNIYHLKGKIESDLINHLDLNPEGMTKKYLFIGSVPEINESQSKRIYKIKMGFLSD